MRAAEKIPVLDLLRAFAIFLVVLYHYWQLTWINMTFFEGWLDLDFLPRAGFFGVEIFLFVSGFCLYYPYALANFNSTPPPTPKEFYTRRFLKIVPSYVLAILFFGVITKTLPLHDLAATFRDVFYHLFFVHPWFRDTYSSIQGVFWSLGVEVQFYYIFPLVAVAFTRRPWVSFFCMLLLANGWRFAIYRDGQVDFFLINQLPGFLDILGFGILSSYLFVRIRSEKLKWPLVLASAGSILFFIYLLKTRRWQETNEVWQLRIRSLMGFALAMVMLTTAFSASLWQNILACRPVRWVSDVSYNLYIWHFYLGHLVATGFFVAQIEEFRTQPPLQQSFMILGPLGALGLASLLTYFFERPIMKYGKARFIRPS